MTVTQNVKTVDKNKLEMNLNSFIIIIIIVT